MAKNLQGPGDRLRYLRQKSRYTTQARLARAAGMSRETVSKHEQGQRNITVDAAEDYARVFGVRPEVILFGDGLNQVSVNTFIKSTRDVAPSTYPLLSSDQLEQFRSIVAGVYPMSDDKVSAPPGLETGERTFAVMMHDQAMECLHPDRIAYGEYAFVDPDETPRAGDVVFAIDVPGFKDGIIRKYRVSSHNDQGEPSFDLIPLNPDYPSVIGASAKGVKVVGPIVGAFRAMRRP